MLVFLLLLAQTGVYLDMIFQGECFGDNIQIEMCAEDGEAEEESKKEKEKIEPSSIHTTDSTYDQWSKSLLNGHNLSAYSYLDVVTPPPEMTCCSV